MIIRQLKNEDAFQHERVASQAFVFTCDTENCELPEELMLGAFFDDNKTLMADMEIGLRENFFCKSTLKCLAVGGVASKPEYRNRGAIRAIFNTLFNEEKYNGGAEISILYPFSFAYYKKFGYESVGRAVELKFPFSELKDIPKCSDVFLYEEQDNPRFFELYNKSAQKNQLSFVREDKKYFTFDPYKTLKYTYVLNDYSAYVTFSVSRKEQTVFVDEIEFLNKASLVKILGFLRAFEGNQKYLFFSKISENSPIFSLINVEKNVSVRLYSMGAARILDVEKVLLKNEYPAEAGEFSLKVIDSVEKNNAVFTVSYENGNVKVSKNKKDPDVILDICAASKILLSGIREPSAIEYMNGVEIINHNEAFLKAFPFRDCFYNDGF